MGRLKTDLASPTRRRQDEAEELGESAGRHAGDRLRDKLKRDHCLTDEEEEAFDRGVERGRKKP